MAAIATLVRARLRLPRGMTKPTSKMKRETRKSPPFPSSRSIRRIGLFLLVAFIARPLPVFRGNDEFVTVINLSTATATPAKVISSDNIVEGEGAPSNVTIYLADAPSHATRRIAWTDLAPSWDRGTTFDDLFDAATATTTEDLRRRLEINDVSVIFHTSPKTASSTLRSACMQIQYDACDLPRKPEGVKWPEGYQSPYTLSRLFGTCPRVRHFCVKEDIPVMRTYIPHYANRTFLHLFPFREYDNWARSALRQIHYRERKGLEDGGCRKMDAKLNRCEPHRFELNLQRYPKRVLAGFIKYFRRLCSQKRACQKLDSHHTLLLHDYRHLDETLAWLHEEYGVPLLPGTDGRQNSDRPEGSCEGEEGMLEKFHNCFSGELRGLH